MMKRSILRFSALAFTLLVYQAVSFAEVKLPSVFSDNMVIQQQTEAAIWGTATPNSTVKISTSWNRKSYTSRADASGKWKVKVTTPAAGGPYTITVTQGNSIVLKNVLVGEVWVCSGQSNMEMPMKGFRNQPITGSNEYISTSANSRIRLITVPKVTSLTPLDDFEGSWKLCEPENVSQFSATAYFFGLLLNQALDVPVGLINTSWGGTRIEPWISESGFTGFDWVQLPDKTVKVEKLSQQTPTVLYNAMINPIAGYGDRQSVV